MNEIMDNDELMSMIRKAVEEALANSLSSKEEVLLTRAGGAKRRRVDCSTLWRWAQAGYLRPIHISSRVWYRQSDVERLERGEREA